MSYPRIFDFRLFGFEVFAEYPSVSRGHTFIDAKVERGELFLWAGRLHSIVCPPWRLPAKCPKQEALSKELAAIAATSGE